MMKTIVMLTLALLMPLAARADAPKHDAKSILEKVAAWEGKMPPVSMDLEIIGVEDLPTEVNEIRFKLHCWRDGERADYVGDDYSTVNGDDTHMVTRRGIWDGQHYLIREVKTPEQQERPPEFYGVGKSAGYLTFRPWVAPYLDYGLGDAPVGKQMLSSGNAALLESEVVDGVRCFVLQAKLGESTYRIWVDPKHSYALRKATKHSERADQVVDVVMSEIELTHVGNTDIITKARLMSKLTEGKKTTYKYDGTATRKNIKLSPDFTKEGAFVMDKIPDGAPVCDLEKFAVPDNSEPSLVWKNGHAVPKE